MELICGKVGASTTDLSYAKRHPVDVPEPELNKEAAPAPATFF